MRWRLVRSRLLKLHEKVYFQREVSKEWGLTIATNEFFRLMMISRSSFRLCLLLSGDGTVQYNKLPTNYDSLFVYPLTSYHRCLLHPSFMTYEATRHMPELPYSRRTRSYRVPERIYLSVYDCPVKRVCRARFQMKLHKIEFFGC